SLASLARRGNTGQTHSPPCEACKGGVAEGRGGQGLRQVITSSQIPARPYARDPRECPSTQRRVRRRCAPIAEIRWSFRLRSLPPEKTDRAFRRDQPDALGLP